MKGYWAYRLLFFACIAFSISAVALTMSSRSRGAPRVEAARPRTSAASRIREVQNDTPVVVRQEPAQGPPAPLESRIRITAVVPFRRQILLHDFGDAAEDLTGWQLVNPRPSGADNVYTFPLGTILLPGESLIVIMDEGIDVPGELHWRISADRRPLDLTSDTVQLRDGNGSTVSRFQYNRS